MPVHVLQLLKFLQKVDVRLLRRTIGTSGMSPQDFLILSLQDMVLLTVVNDLFPLRVSVLFGEVDPVIR